LIQVCRAFIDLIEGKIGYLASEGGPMPGSTKIT